MENHKKIIILIRHGQTEFNKKNIFRGHIDVPLDNSGKIQAESNGKLLKEMDFDTIYTSPLIRAKQTSEIINKYQSKNVSTMVDYGFIDLNYGTWEGKTEEEIKALFPEHYFQWETNPFKTKIPDGESLNDAEKRSWLSLKKIISKNENQIICIITHRVICKLLICKILGISKSGFWKIKQDTSCINIIEYSEKKFSVLKLNYNSNVYDFMNSLKVVDF